MMMWLKHRIVTRGTGIEFEFANKAGRNERMEGVVDGSPRRTDPVFVQCRPEFIDGGVVGMAQQVIEEGDALRCAAQTSGGQRIFNIVDR